MPIWSKEELIKAAEIYTTSTEFIDGNMAAYTATIRHFSILEIAPHFKRRNTWTKATIIKEAAKFSTRSEFKDSSNQAVKAARKLGILEEVMNVFPKLTTTRITGTSGLQGKIGIYILYLNDDIVYVGKSLSNIGGRVQAHIKDTNKIFNKVISYEISNPADINIIEMYMIGLHTPALNKDYGNSTKTTLTINGLDELIIAETTYIQKDNEWQQMNEKE